MRKLNENVQLEMHEKKSVRQTLMIIYAKKIIKNLRLIDRGLLLNSSNFSNNS